MKWITFVFFWNLNTGEVNKLTSTFFKLIDQWIKNSGVVWTIKRLKILRNICTRYIIKDPIIVNTDKIGVTKDGFPLCLLFLKEYVDSGDISKLRYVMTLLVLSRSINFKGKVNYKSITDPFNGKVKTIDPTFIARFVSDNSIDLTHDGISWSSFIFTYRGGVYGKQLWTAVQSLMDWNATLLACGCIMGSTSFNNIVLTMKKMYPNMVKEIKPSIKKLIGDQRPLRKLSIVYDPE